MKIVIFTMTILASFSVLAGATKVACQVTDSEGKLIRKMKPFIANSRSSHPLRVTEDGVLYLRWNYYTSPIKVLITKNPYYPFNIPFKTDVLGHAEIDLDNTYQDIDISAISEGLVLNCEKVAK